MKATPTQLFERWYLRRFGSNPKVTVFSEEDYLDMKAAYRAGRASAIRDCAKILSKKRL